LDVLVANSSRGLASAPTRSSLSIHDRIAHAAFVDDEESAVRSESRCALTETRFSIVRTIVSKN
jgi:hypothetical protein